MYIKMKFPKYSCSACGKPSSRKWNLARHISNCHAGIGNCRSNWDFASTYKPYWSGWDKKAMSEKENSHYIRQGLLRQFLSSGNDSIDRNPIPDYQRIFMEECFREIARKVGSIVQPTQTTMSFPFSHKINQWSAQQNCNVNPATNLQIFGYRGYVCNKCLLSETHYIGFPEASGQGRLDQVHFCDPKKVAAAGELVGRFGLHRVLRSEIPMLIKQKVNSSTSNNNHLVALKLSSPPEEIIRLRNPANPAKPRIVFIYSEERHLTLEPDKEGKTKSNYLIRAIKHDKTLLNDEELTDFLESIWNATFGIVRVHDMNTYKTEPAEKGGLHQELLQSYFVYVPRLPPAK